MKVLILLVVLICSAIVGRGQVASVNSIMKEVEKSYHAGEYEATLIKLEQAQKNSKENNPCYFALEDFSAKSLIAWG